MKREELDLKTGDYFADCFGPAIEEWKLKISLKYDHDTEIKTFIKWFRNLEKVHHYDPELCDKNYTNPTHRLIPGKIYLVKIIPIIKTIHDENIIKYMHHIGALFVGAQGLTQIARKYWNKFEEPIESGVSSGDNYSYDEEDRLYTNGIHDGFGIWHRIPNICRSWNDAFYVYIANFGTNRGNHPPNKIICFFELPNNDSL